METPLEAADADDGSTGEILLACLFQMLCPRVCSAYLNMQLSLTMSVVSCRACLCR